MKRSTRRTATQVNKPKGAKSGLSADARDAIERTRLGKLAIDAVTGVPRRRVVAPR